MTRIRSALAAAAAFVLATAVTCGTSEAASTDRRKARKELDKILKQFEKSGAQRMGREAAEFGADSYYDAARKAYAELEYARALELAKKALEVNPNHPDARRLARRLRGLLGTQPDWARHGLELFSREKKVRIQESLMTLSRAREEGTKYMNAVEELEIDKSQSPEIILSQQTRLLGRAIGEFDRCLELIKWMPYQLDLLNDERQIRGLRDDAITLRGKREEALRIFRRSRAVDEAQRQSGELDKALRRKLQQLLRMAKQQYDLGHYFECEDICMRVLKENPGDREAKALKGASTQKRHEVKEWEIYTTTGYEWTKQMDAVEEAAIPYSERLRYPDNWDVICRRVEKVGKLEQMEEPEWERVIRMALDRKVSFEFNGTPLSEAIDFLRALTNVNMIMDVEANETKGDTLITLKVTKMTLGLALDWILRLAELDYALQDNALYISEKDKLRGNVTLRIYDVRDLTETIPDYPGPELSVDLSGGGGGEGGGGLFDMEAADMGEEVTASSLANMIMERVNPGDWDATLGTSIEERGGKLVVMQRPQVHRLIDRLLESFRAAQKLLVNVEARFLEIREGFFEEIGIDFGRIPGIGLGAGAPLETYLPGTGPAADPWAAPAPNEFGASVGTGYIMSETLYTGDNTLYGGIMQQPRNVDIGGPGTMHTIGSVINYRPNVSPNPTRIGGEMVTGGLLEQGLNAQIRHIGQIELMGFIHALRVREGGSVLSAPRLTVMNTQRAHMFVGEMRSYIADYEISGGAYDPIIRQFIQGIVFDVKPIVSADRRYITMELRPTTATLVQMDSIGIAGFVFIGDPPVPMALSLPIQFPELELRKVRTTVTIPDGGIVMIGGMMTNIKFQAETGVPFLSNLPIIGKLFRWNTTDNERRNLSVLVTGRILLFDEEEQKR